MKKAISLSVFPIIILLVSLQQNKSLAAEVSTARDTWGDLFVEITGDIRKGDLEKIKKVAAHVILQLDPAAEATLKLHLNTPGGDIVEAMKIGRFARDILASIESYGNIIIAPGGEDEKLFVKNGIPERGYAVLSPQERITDREIVRNYSAGILIFYGAVIRAHSDNSDQRLGFYKKVTIPVMGIHRPYYNKESYSKLSPSEASYAYKALENDFRHYLLDMGAPQSIVDRIFDKSSNEIELIPAEEFRRLYKERESFLDEWLIAKCGATGYENILKGKELNDFEFIKKHQIASWTNDQRSEDRPVSMSGYPVDGYPQKYIQELYEKVRNYNVSIDHCTSTAVLSHQKQWARSYLKQ